MFIGIDVGGTHTDAVMALPGKVLKTAKTPTRLEDMAGCVGDALALLLEGERPECVRRVCVSSTLGLNALLTGNHDRVGLLTVPGPGMDSLGFWRGDPLFATLEGAQDHRGVVTLPVNRQKALEALNTMRDRGAQAVAVVAKFSPKNPDIEEQLADSAAAVFPEGTPVVTGSSVSGSLNFPRRVHTAWCRAALARTGRAFIESLESGMRRLGLTCPLAILKADAGTFSAREAALDPTAGMGSGPSAGMLGIMAVAGHPGTALMLDVGGTTTDIALLVHGEPLLARTGLTIAGRPTLVRALWSTSVAVSGDSALHCEDGRPVTGPQRRGNALCFDASGDVPALMDALNVLGMARVGNIEASLQGIRRLTASGKSGETDPVRLARLFLDDALTRIREAGQKLLADVKEKPVYTIREVLVDSVIYPEQLTVIGTPAQALAPALAGVFNLPSHVPEHHAFANAVGAALALPTRMAELYADTELGMMRIPSLGITRPIDGRYTLDDATRDLRNALKTAGREDKNNCGEAGTLSEPDCEDALLGEREAQATFGESFAVLADNGRRGRIIRAGAQLPAGVMQRAGEEKNRRERAS